MTNMEESKKHGWAFWSVVALLVLLVVYPLSFGPACWIASRVGEVWFISTVYQPLMRFCWEGRGEHGFAIPQATMLGKFGELFVAPGHAFGIDDRKGDRIKFFLGKTPSDYAPLTSP